MKFRDRINIKQQNRILCFTPIEDLTNKFYN